MRRGAIETRKAAMVFHGVACAAFNYQARRHCPKKYLRSEPATREVEKTTESAAPEATVSPKVMFDALRVNIPDANSGTAKNRSLYAAAERMRLRI